VNYNAADRKSVRKAEKEAKLALKQRQAVVKDLLSTGPGREYIWDLLSFGSIFNSQFYPDSHQAAYVQGMRNFALRILDDITQACPEQFLLMMQENNAKSLAKEDDNDDDTDEVDESEDVQS
jgi:hypothetical protein